MTRFILAGLLVGCGADESEPTCEATLLSTFPAEGATDAYVRTTVEFTFSEPVAQTMAVTSPVDGNLSVRDDGFTLVFTPAEPLDTNTSYTFGVEGCIGEESIFFETNDLGAPLADDLSLEGAAFHANLGDARYLTNQGIGDLLKALFQQEIVTGVSAQNGDELDLIMALASTDMQQDYCARTLDMPGADFSEAPYFEIGPMDLNVAGFGSSLLVYDFGWTGTFKSDGSAIEGQTLEGFIDAREVATLEGAPDEDGVCDLVEAANVPCEACPDGAEYCVNLAADSIVSPAVDLLVEHVEKGDPRCVKE